VVTDGERVYVYFGSIGLVAALDLDGRPLWTREVGAYSQGVTSTARPPRPFSTRTACTSSNSRQRISAGSSAFTASPWAYNGKIFLLSEDGDTFVVQAGPEFKLLGRNSLNGMTLATPAVLRGSLILRTQSKLYRIAKVRR
jgi:hypothetical protein